MGLGPEMGVLALSLQKGFPSIAGKPGRQPWTSVPRPPTETIHRVLCQDGVGSGLRRPWIHTWPPCFPDPTFPRRWSSTCEPSAMCAKSPLARPGLLQ